MQTLECGEETGLSVENRDVFGMIGWAFAMKVEDHSALLHCRKDGVKLLIRYDSCITIRRDTSWVRLDSNDALSFGPFDDCWADALVEVEGHQIGDRGVLFEETLFVC